MRPVIAQRQTAIRSAGMCSDWKPKSLPAARIRCSFFITIVVIFVPLVDLLKRRPKLRTIKLPENNSAAGLTL